ncbi:MAG: hypothetical protein NDJ89_02090 [Oligoflexia bacterium]|nr:hypothetical protein [Oligoflexia bacterium]
MRVNLACFSAAAGVFAIGLTFFWGCSTTELRPIPPPVLAAPKYVEVPQPAGFDISDISAIFVDKRAPAAESLTGCDADYRKLQKLTQSEDELKQGMGELVKADPVAYHWCFYGKILELERFLKTADYVDERQKKVLEAYGFLVPLARGFLSEFHDSRYLRWAIRHYRGTSEWVFFQKLDQAPRMTAELVEVANPFGLWREPAASRSVLEKYQLVKEQPQPEASASPKMIFPPAEAEAEPATESSPLAMSPSPQPAGPSSEPEEDLAAGPPEGEPSEEAAAAPVTDLSSPKRFPAMEAGAPATP